jgi:hypothetical protein
MPLAAFLLDLLVSPEGGGTTFLRNVEGFLPDYTTLHLIRPGC